MKLPHLTIALLLTVALLLARSAAAAEPPVKAELVEVIKIWDAAPHNAFTDLVRFHDQWFCAFREGEDHISPHGKLRILRSTDGKEWKSAGLLEHSVYDLRDACISVTPDGRLMVLGGAQQAGNGAYPTGTVVSFSDDGAKWTAPEVVFPLGDWLWRVTWNGDRAYGITYGTKEHGPITLQSTADGLKYEQIKFATPLPTDGWLTEARLRFGEDGTAYCLQRRDASPNTALLGQAKPPYVDWQWKDLGLFFGGPNFIQTPADDWIAAGRIIDDSHHTDVAWLDVDQGKLVSLLELPSGGDCSYPGMVWHDGLLWISYYSSHEGKTSIYLAKVRITPR